jgi:hypothetical protein
MTRPMGENPISSSGRLLIVLMKSCVVRVFGPAVAKLTMPRRLLCLTESSGISILSHAACTLGEPCIPNCTMKELTTRKKRTSSK